MLDATLTTRPAPAIAGRFRRLDPATRPVPWLLATGVAALAIYGGYFAPAFWLPSAYPGPFADVPYLLGTGYAALFGWAGFITLLFALYAVALRAASALPSRRTTLALILAIGGAQLASLLVTYPATNSDVFHYTAEARVLWFHGANPLLTPPEAFDFPDIEPNMWWWWQPSPYGPLWALLGGLPIAAGGHDAASTIVAFKAMAALFWLATAALAYVAVAPRRPERAPFAAAFLALNPLAVMLIAIGGQNDAAMMFCVALGFLLLDRGKPLPAPSAFVAAALIKPAAALFLPFALLFMVMRTPWRDWSLGWALAAAVAVAVYTPFWEGAITFDVLRTQSELFTVSPGALMARLLERTWALETAQDVVRATGIGLFALTAGIATVRWARRGGESLAAITAAAVLAYLMLAAFWFQPWYVLWLLPPAAFAAASDGRRLLTVAAVFSWSAMMIYVIINFGWYLWWTGRPDDDPVQFFGPAVVFVPPLLTLAAISVAGPLRALGEAIAGTSGGEPGARQLTRDRRPGAAGLGRSDRRDASVRTRR